MKLDDDKTRLLLAALANLPQMYGRDCRVVRWAFAYRRLRNKLWWQSRRRFLSYFKKGPPRDNRLHVFWHLRGGLGDCAVARLAVLAMRQHLPRAVFYLHTDSPYAATALFEPNEQTVLLPPGQPLWYKYDVAFETCQSFKTVHANRRRIAEIEPDFLPLLDKMAHRQQEVACFLQDNYLLEDLMGLFLVQKGFARADWLSYLSGLDFDPSQAPALPAGLTSSVRLERFGLAGKKYITLHDGIDATFSLHGLRPLKCWPVAQWRKLAALLKARYPDILLVQVGGKNSVVFDFADISLIGKTQVADLPALLQSSLLHIDGESGLVQLSRGLKTRCVVLFGPTDKRFFGLEKNINLKQDVCGSCMWLLGTSWHVRCALGYPSCRNLDALHAAQVLAAAEEALSERLK